MTDLAANLPAPQILDFRENWIRDLYTAPVISPAAPQVALSEFNKSRKVSFFSDAQIEAIYDRVIVEWAEELGAVQYEKEQERLDEGDVLATATIVGDALREQALFRLMRVVCRRAMIEDPGFRASVTVGMKDPTAIFKVWESLNAADLMWVRSRSGSFNTIEIERG